MWYTVAGKNLSITISVYAYPVTSISAPSGMVHIKVRCGSLWNLHDDDTYLYSYDLTLSILAGFL